MKLSRLEKLVDIEDFIVFEIQYSSLFSKKEKYALVIYQKETGDFKDMSTGRKFWKREDMLFETTLQFLAINNTSVIEYVKGSSCWWPSISENLEVTRFFEK